MYLQDQDESRATEIIRRYLAIQKSHEERMHAVHALNSMREEESFSLRQLSDFNDVTLESVPDELALVRPTHSFSHFSVFGGGTAGTCYFPQVWKAITC